MLHCKHITTATANPSYAKNKFIKAYLIVMYKTWWYLLSITALGFALCIACTVETRVLACVTYCFLEYYYCSIHAVE